MTSPSMDERKLLPCPFCGSPPIAGERWYADATGGGYGWAYVECANCDCISACLVDDDSPMEAAERWNRRARS